MKLRYLKTLQLFGIFKKSLLNKPWIKEAIGKLEKIFN
jgi:hypothetical protein